MASIRRPRLPKALDALRAPVVTPKALLCGWQGRGAAREVTGRGRFGQTRCEEGDLWGAPAVQLLERQSAPRLYQSQSRTSRT